MGEKRIRKYDPDKYNPKVQAAANKRYREKNVRHVGIDINKNTEADILEKIETVNSISGYIKTLIRQDSTLYKTS